MEQAMTVTAVFVFCALLSLLLPHKDARPQVDPELEAWDRFWNYYGKLCGEGQCEKADHLAEEVDRAWHSGDKRWLIRACHAS